MDNTKLIKLFWEKGLPMGRVVSTSKTKYRNNNPGNEVYFNANVFGGEGKLWFGDIDLTIDSDALQSIADESRVELYVLREHDGRFDNEDRPMTEVRDIAVRTFTPAKLTLFDVVSKLFKK